MSVHQPSLLAALACLAVAACNGSNSGPPGVVPPVVPPTTPSLVSVSPDSGFTSGGQRVTLTGAGFTSSVGRRVTFGGIEAVITSVENSSMIVRIPPGVGGAVDVSVSNASGDATLTGAFTYYPWPPAFSADDQRVDRNAGNERSFIPVIAADGAHVYVAWEDSRSGASQIYFNRSADRGLSWEPADMRIDRSPAAVGSSFGVELAAASGAVYAVWQDGRNGNLDIYFNRSLDGGVTWEAADTRLDTDVAGAAGSASPRILCEGSRVYVVWNDFRNGQADVYFNRSTDKGATWDPSDRRVNTGPLSATAFDARLAAEGDSVYAVWTDGRNDTGSTGLQAFDIYFNRSVDEGATWDSDDVRINTNPPGSVGSFTPQIGAFEDEVYVAWQDGRNEPLSPLPHQDIYFSRSADRGASWLDQDVRIERDLPGEAASFDVQMTCSGRMIHLVWSDSRNDIQPLVSKHDVYLNRSTDGGLTWQASDVRLDTDAPGSADSRLPRICSSGSSVFVVWEEKRGARDSVFLNCSTDAGATWLPADVRLEADAAGGGNALCPRIVCDGARIHIAWSDRRNGNWDVYFDGNER